MPSGATPFRRKETARTIVECTLEDIYVGAIKVVPVNARLVRVAIPIGCPNRLDLEIPGIYSDIEEGGSKSSIPVTIQCRSHKDFIRDENGVDLHMYMQVTFDEYIDGFSHTIQTVSGKPHTIHGRFGGMLIDDKSFVLVAENCGMPMKNSVGTIVPGTYGDLYIHLSFELPNKVPVI